LNAFGYDRRSALWQAERAVRPAGEMFTTLDAEFAEPAELAERLDQIDSAESASSAVNDAESRLSAEALAEAEAPSLEPLIRDPESRVPSPEPDPCPLRPMTESERLVADYAGTGLTVGRHPMALRRDELAMRGILRAIDLRAERNGRRVRVAGM